MKSFPFFFMIFLSIGCLLFSCNEENDGPTLQKTEEPLNPDGRWRAVPAFESLTFNNPVEVVSGSIGSNRLYILEQSGIITSLLNDASNPSPVVFLDIRDRVKSGGELGLLGMALHPQFVANGQVYVHYTREVGGTLQSVISLFPFPKSGGPVDKSKEEVILSYDQPFANHNGGSIHFGKDGFLYVTTGDGGSAGDPNNHAQDLSSYLGKVLRLDINQKNGQKNYRIPPSNPFVDVENALGEIYAYGLRNPWKMNLDPVTEQFWLADVGQNTKEEINVLIKGANYGWRITEGFDCFSPSTACDKTGLTDPIWDYGVRDGRSVTGGYVYRGAKWKQLLEGKYIYGDYVSGSVWAISYDTENNKVLDNKQLLNVVGAISSFGLTEKGELFIVNYRTGKLEELVFI